MKLRSISFLFPAIVKILTDREPKVKKANKRNKNRINANAVALIYYDRGIIKNDVGLLTGLKKISFRKTSLLSIEDQVGFDSARVFGICSNFRIGL